MQVSRLEYSLLMLIRRVRLPPRAVAVLIADHFRRCKNYERLEIAHIYQDSMESIEREERRNKNEGKNVCMSRKFTFQELILFCKDVNREYLTEPGLIFFDISIGHNQYISLGLSSVARGILYGYNLDGYYVCDSIDTFGDITHINLKPAE